MQQFTFAPGDTSKTIDIFLADSSSTTGAGLSGLVYNSSGLAAYYRNTATGTVTALTLATQTVGGAYSSGGFVELDATHAKGLYRLDIPNAVLTSAGNGFIHIYGATNLAQCPVQIVVGYPQTNLAQILGTAVSTPATAGILDVNIKNINNNATSASNIQRSTAAIVLGTVGSSSSTTSIVTSSLSPAAAATDQFKGRIVTFDYTTATANLRGQATDITGSSSGGVLTVTALTTAPVSGDTFTIT